MASFSLSTDFWEETVEEFRRLGGIVENLRPGVGENGRGLFVIDPEQEARIWLPPELLVPTRDALLRDDRVLVEPGAADPAVTAFFERYQERFGWSAIRDDIYATQRAWHELPDDVRNAIAQSGVLTYESRFLAPSEQSAFDEFVNSRTGRFKTGSLPVFIPILELVNHRSDFAGYEVDAGVGMRGRFTGEAFVRYNSFDAIHCALTYSFASAPPFATSVSITVDLPGGRALAIDRNLNIFDELDGWRVPKLAERGNLLDLSHLLLGHLQAPMLPRAIFREIMKPYLSRDDADNIFDGIAHFNRSRWIGVLRILRRHSGPMIDTLEEAVLNQLEALSASVGGAFPPR